MKRIRWTPARAVAALAIMAASVVGALGYVTATSLRLEAAEREAARRAEKIDRERRALWRLDSALLTPLALETGRPFGHYQALSPAPTLVRQDGSEAPSDGLCVPSPLLTAEMPDWMALHVRFDAAHGWLSPQVLAPLLYDRLQSDDLGLNLATCSDAKAVLLQRLNAELPPAVALAVLKDGVGADDESNAYRIAVVMPDEPAASKNSSVQRNFKCPESPACGTEGGTIKCSLGIDTRSFPKPASSLLYFAGNLNRLPTLESAKSNPDKAAPTGRTQAPAPQNPSQGRGFSRMANPADEDRDTAARRELTNQAYTPKGGYDSPVRGGNGGFNSSNYQSLAHDGSSRVAGAWMFQYYFQTPAKMPSMACAPSAQAPTLDLGSLPSYTLQPGAGVANGVWDAAGQASHFGFATNLDAYEPSLHLFVSGSPTIVIPGASEPKSPPGTSVVNVRIGATKPHWLVSQGGARHLALLRPVETDEALAYQGVVFDWEKLQVSLQIQVRDLYPAATFRPADGPAETEGERTMTALPVVFQPNDAPPPEAFEWSPLRWGLLIAWAAAILCIVGVGFGGRAILAMSARRMRFASAVTHELRTPLTAMQLHLDLLNSGLVSDEERKAEYMATISSEADRLNRLVTNVLDFARLETKAARSAASNVPCSEILEALRREWTERLDRDGFELVALSTVPADAAVRIDPRVLHQVLGNLLDNARKYAKHATDRRLWVWVKPASASTIALEVEDRGPGVPAGERRTVFKAFQRGSSTGDSGGAGLGLALAKQWIELFDGTISCLPAEGGEGCRFRIELPLSGRG